MRVSLLHNKEACNTAACCCRRVYAARMNFTWSPAFCRLRGQELKSEKHPVCLAGMIGIDGWQMEGWRKAIGGPGLIQNLLGRVHTKRIAKSFCTSRLHSKSMWRRESTQVTGHCVGRQRWRGEQWAFLAQKKKTLNARVFKQICV